jgi:hypothetical protein
MAKQQVIIFLKADLKPLIRTSGKGYLFLNTLRHLKICKKNKMTTGINAV